MDGVILAAGESKRLSPISQYYPKPLLRICNKSNIIYQLEYMKKIGIRRCHIVIGYRSENVIQVIGNGSFMGIDIHYVEQKERLGIAHAVSLLEPFINDSFILLLGDIFFNPNNNFFEISQISKNHKLGTILGSTKENSFESIKKNYLIKSLNIYRNVGRVIDVIEKPTNPISNIKGNGMYVFDRHIFDAIKKTPKSKYRNEYEITTAISILINQGIKVYHCFVCNWDVNITYPRDLWICNMRFFEEQGYKNVISKKAQIHPDARITQSIIEDDVFIDYPISIKNSIITAKTHIKHKNNILNKIVIPTGNEINVEV